MKHTEQKKVNRHHALKVMDWCRIKYGRSKYNGRYPGLEFKIDRECLERYGYYDDIENVIVINSVTNTDVFTLINTVIEEWTHYMQSQSEYSKLDEKYYYHEHPMELEAERIAKRDYKKCYKDLKKLHKSFAFL